MPSKAADLTPAWYRELNVVGSYASRGAGDFATALDLASHGGLGGFVDGVYPLAHWRDALAHALAAGRSGSVKIAFAPQQEHRVRQESADRPDRPEGAAG
jgi:threonine dehydrogenase-like Zn-dependent dehydrogenase